MSRRTILDYHVGWLCALPKEMTAARAMLDEEHEPFESDGSIDDNNYVLGHIAGHNIVIACLPAGIYGNNAAATAATHLQRTFTDLRFGFMVGIGGGIPNSSDESDIRLGDVVISQPDKTHGGVVQYDMVKDLGEGVFEQKGSLRPPPTILLKALATLRSQHDLKPSRVPEFLVEAKKRYPRLSETGYSLPGPDKDILHCSHVASCEQCSNGIVSRSPRNDSDPRFHYGVIASGNVLMKNSAERDRIGRQFGAKCLDMEAAGLMNEFPCIVIRGICDYADAYKNDVWQKYAALVAAAFAKELLLTMAPANVAGERVVQSSGQTNVSPRMTNMPGLSRHFVGRTIVIDQIKAHFSTQTDTIAPDTVVLFGSGGIGKSQIALRYAMLNQSDYNVVVKIDCSERTSLEADLKSLATKVLPHSAENDIAALFTFLSNSGKRWLLLYDGFDKERGTQDWFQLDQFLPQRPNSGAIHIIITSRSQTASNFGRAIRIATMDHDEATNLFLKTSSLDSHTTDSGVIHEIYNEFGGIPLAIDVAGNYVRQELSARQGEPDAHSQVLQVYLQRCKDTRKDFTKFLFQSNSSLSTNPSYTLTVYSAWRMSFDYVSALDESAAKLLLLLAFIHHRVPAESLYIKTACLSRRRWGPSGEPCILTPTEAGIPEWLLDIVGFIPDQDGQPGINSIRLESAVNLLVRLSLLRKTTNTGNGHDNWMSHQIFRECAKLHCDKDLTLELAACALNVFIANRPSLDDGHSVKSPNHSVGLYEQLPNYLSSNLVFGPFKNNTNYSYGWEQIEHAVSAALGGITTLDFTNTLDLLAFVSRMGDLCLSCTPLDSDLLLSCLQEATAIRHQTAFNLERASLMFFIYRMKYYLVGRGMSKVDQRPDLILHHSMIKEVIEIVCDSNFLRQDVEDQCLLAISVLLFSINKLLLYSKSDDNPSFSCHDLSLDELDKRWVEFRYSPNLIRYATKIQLCIGSSDHILLRARAAVFIEFARQASLIPICDAEPTYAMKKYARQVMDILIISFADLETLGLRHICATVNTPYLVFDLLGCIRRIYQHNSEPIFLAEARIILSRHEQHLSQQLKRSTKATLLHELMSKISDQTWNVVHNCGTCVDVLNGFNAMQNEATIEQQAVAMYARQTSNLESILDVIITNIENVLSTLDRLESTDPDDYANRDKNEDQIAKLKASLRSVLFDNPALQWMLDPEKVSSTLQPFPPDLDSTDTDIKSAVDAFREAHSQMSLPANFARYQSVLKQLMSRIDTSELKSEKVSSKGVVQMRSHWAWYDNYRQWQAMRTEMKTKTNTERVKIQLSRLKNSTMEHEMEHRSWKLEELVENAEYVRKVAHIDSDLCLLDMGSRLDWSGPIQKTVAAISN